MKWLQGRRELKLLALLDEVERERQTLNHAILRVLRMF